ncbi:MTS domain-containing protein [Meloidogyne graminicola]|uniref:MTS domain-containing protein n=1 Tax=Meloidogyne graminicola TaxID=189291 RepID=A0A8S9ZWE7_9BILA|nr:MTS domain-containing protein [Meloidogyne graminicola]
MVNYIPTPEYKIDPELHKNVYPPSEDTFLLIDALAKEKDIIISLKPIISLEIGCGSGVVTCFLQKLLKNENLLTSDSIGPLIPRLYNSLDLLLLNPPYVLTEESSKNEQELSYAGGPEGRNLLNKLLPLISKLLSLNGIFYLVAIKENNIFDLISDNSREKFGLNGSILLERQCRNEHLYILKFTKINKESQKQLNITTKTKMLPNKITLVLKPVGAAPQLRKEFTKYKVDPNWTIFNLQQTLRKLLGVKTEPLYLFIKEAFAPSPESTIGSLHQCFGAEGGILYIHYGLTPAWG